MAASEEIVVAVRELQCAVQSFQEDVCRELKKQTSLLRKLVENSDKNPSRRDAGRHAAIPSLATDYT